MLRSSVASAGHRNMQKWHCAAVADGIGHLPSPFGGGGFALGWGPLPALGMAGPARLGTFG